MTEALSGFGVLLKIGDGGGGEVFTTIAEVKDISGPKLSLDTDEVTSRSSPNAWTEFIATCLSAGEISFESNFLPKHATQSYSTGLLKDMTDKKLRNFQLILPTNPTVTWAFAAYITSFEPKFPVKGAMTASWSLKISGQPTLAA